MSPAPPPPAAPRPVTLDTLPCRTPAQLVGTRACGALAERLAELGLVPGTPLTVMRRGPWGDPLQLSLRGYQLCMRRDQAAQIEVQQAPAPLAGTGGPG